MLSPSADVRLSLPTKLFLCIQLLSNEATGYFHQLFVIPVLQTLGMPLRMAPLVGLAYGPTAAVFIPLLGWLSDRGTNPTRRKLVVVACSTSLMLIGLTCVIVANSLRLGYLDDVINASAYEDVNSSASTSAPQETRPVSLNQSRLKLASSGFDTTKLDMLDPMKLVAPPVEGTNEFGNTSAEFPVSSKTLTSPMAFITTQSEAKATTTSIQHQTASVPFNAILAMMGFIVSEIGYDSANGFVRAHVLACSPRSEHTSLLVLGLLVASLGGMMTSVLGMVDLSSVFQDILPSGADPKSEALVVQTSIHAAVLILLLVLGFVLSVLASRAVPGQSDVDVIITEKDHIIFQRTEESSLNKITCSCSGQKNQANASQDQEPCKSYGSVCKCTDGKWHSKADDTNPADLPSPKPQSSQRQPGRFSSKNRERKGRIVRRMFAICTSMLFTCGSYCMFSIMISDYVGKAIHKGDPTAEPGDASFHRYTEGVRTATKGFLTVAITYLLISMVHSRVLSILGHKAEFILVQLLMAGSMVLLSLTARLEVFFLLSVVAGIHRACRYVVPYDAANKILQGEPESSDTAANTVPNRMGLAVSLVASMVPLANCMLLPWVGQLEEWTGLVSAPLWLGAAFSCIAAVAFLLA